MCWTELTEYEQEVFNCGVAFGSTPVEEFISDGNGPYLKTAVPAMRLEAGDNHEEFALLLDLFWAGWNSEDHTWMEDNYT